MRRDHKDMLKKISFGFIAVMIASVLTISSCSRNIKARSDSSSTFSLSPRVSHGRLDNGLNYYFLRSAEPAGRCFVRLNVGVGSFYEEDNELGIAHFLEHLAFDDRSISGDESLAEWLQKNGMSIGPDANAQTAQENTVYKLDLPNCDEATLVAALNIFRSFADGLKFRPEAIAKENNIIGAEEREQDDPQMQLSKRLLSELYSGTAYVTRPVLGDAVVRAAFRDESFLSFYKKWYTPENMTVVLIGDYGSTHPQALISDAFASMEKRSTPKKPKAGRPEHKSPYFALNENYLAHVETIFSIQAKKITKPNFSIKLLKDKLAFDLAISLLQEIFATKFQQTQKQIREPSIDGNFIDDGVYEINLSVASLNQDLEEKFIEAYAEILRAAELGFDEATFNAAKTVLRDSLEQAIITETNLTGDAWAGMLIDHVNGNSPAADATHYMMVAEPILSALTVRDVQVALRRAMRSGNHYLYALGAIDENAASNKRLKDLLTRARKIKPSSLLVDKPVDFLYRTLECSETPVMRETLPHIDAAHLRLKNGIEIIFRPTTHEADKIYITISNSLGDASMSKEDFVLASFAKYAMFEGALGKHDGADLSKLVRDVFFNLSLSVLPDRIQSNITTRTKDLQFVLELTKAFITDAYYAQSAIDRIKEQIALAHHERGHQLWTPINNEFAKAVAGNDHRVGIIPLPEIQAITREALLDWHKRFIASQPLRIVVVGDFAEEVVGNKLACIFGDLAEHKRPVATITNLVAKAGITQSHNTDAKDKAALIKLRYPLNFTGERYPDHRWQIIQAIINETVRLKLREKQQDTYSPTVVMMENKVSEIQNLLDIIFFADVKKADKTVKDVKMIVDKLAQKGINKSQLKKASEPYIAQAERALMDNNYWASLLANNFDDVKKLTWTKSVASDIKAISIKEINLLLRKYFRVNNVSSAIAYPSIQ